MAPARRMTRSNREVYPIMFLLKYILHQNKDTPIKKDILKKRILEKNQVYYYCYSLKVKSYYFFGRRILTIIYFLIFLIFFEIKTSSTASTAFTSFTGSILFAWRVNIFILFFDEYFLEFIEQNIQNFCIFSTVHEIL